MSQFRLVFRVHAIQRMFQQKISEEEVKQVVATGETIETYPTDKPFPSHLFLGWIGSRPIHVVVADDAPLQETIIVTVYQPDTTEWES
ncbi:MAG: DUF4258 domain-containing protein [Nitrospirota bacterium]